MQDRSYNAGCANPHTHSSDLFMKININVLNNYRVRYFIKPATVMVEDYEVRVKRET
jgi:hypothetical protein